MGDEAASPLHEAVRSGTAVEPLQALLADRGRADGALLEEKLPLLIVVEYHRDVIFIFACLFDV